MGHGREGAIVMAVSSLARFARRWRARFRQIRRDGERGITFVEISIMTLIVTIALVSITTAIRTASRGTLMAKERNRAMSLARDRLESVKHLGYQQLTLRASNYVYPDQPDPSNPLTQVKAALPYPASPPTTDEDPWPAETIQLGGVTYWRHVVIKFVTEPGVGQPLEQYPAKCTSCTPPEAGGTGGDSNLAYIEVDVTWFSRRTGKTEQTRVMTLLANTSNADIAIGVISGTVMDDNYDVVSDSTDGGATLTPLPQPLGSDDHFIDLGSVIVTARDLVTNQSFSVSTDAKGLYTLKNLPNGSYLVEVRGTPWYADSGFNNATSPPNSTYPLTPIELTPGKPEAKGIDIYTQQLRTFTVNAKYQLPAPVLPGLPHEIRISANDGLSEPVTVSISDTDNCEQPGGCWVQLPGLSWPAVGNLWYTVWLEDLTQGTIVTTTLCVDSAVAPSDFYIGENPALHPGSNNCTGGCTPGSLNCVSPPWTAGPVLVSGGSFLPASVRVKVKEFYNGGDANLADPTLARVSMLAPLDGICVTLGVDSVGVTIFESSVPLEAAGNITFNAYMTSTGWTTDSFVLPFDTDSSFEYDLDSLNGTSYSSNPPPEQKHLFVLTRVSEISGTVWKVAGITPFPNASVQIKNTGGTQWANVVKADSAGRFSHKQVPVAAAPYTVAPVLGTDYVSVPANASILVNTHGTVYPYDTANNPFEFVLSAINGIIRGKVTHGGEPVTGGAVVIASTYNGTFPTTLPAGVLGGAYTYSTVTMTDGTYELKVATGVMSYYMYAYMMKDGAVHTYASSPASIAVTADSTTTFDVPIP